MIYLLWIQDVNGDQAPIVAFDVAITETLGSFDSLAFNFLVDPNDEQDPNAIAANMIVPRSIVTEPTTGKQFMVLQPNPVSVGDKVQYTVTCTSVGYKLHDNYVEATLSNTQSLKTCMDLITKGTPFTYQISGTFANYAFSETFGGDYSDDLLTTLASDFSFEFYFDNYTIHIQQQIGKSGAFLFVEGANAGPISKQEDYSTIKTYIKGYGKQNDDGTYACTADYTSPYAKTYEKDYLIWADPYSDDSTDKNVLLAKLKQEIHDYPDVQYSMDYVDFKNSLQGFTNDTSIGNTGYLRNRFGIDVSVRIQARTYYPQEQDAGQNGSITFGNKIFDPTLFMTQMKKAQNQNKKLGDELEKGLITLKQYYQQLNQNYQEQSTTVANLQDEINKLQANGIFVDVSSNNEDDSVSWFVKLLKAGAKAVMVKLTQSTDYTNPLAAAQIANAKTAGLDFIGGYHYFMGNGTAEGQYFLAQLQALSVPKTAIVALDIEDSSIDPTKNGATITKDELNAQIAAFYKVLTDAGYMSTCDYSSKYYFDTWFNSAASLKWVADYDVNSKPDLADAWQFSKNWQGLGVDASYGYEKIFI